MSGESKRRKITAREKRLLVYLLLAAAFAAWKFIPRPWHPTLTLNAPHHRIFSTATREQTEATAHTLELLWQAYSNRFGGLPGFETNPPPLQVKLFKDRAEFRRINPGLGWAEAYYRRPYCRAYYSAEEKNPYHWMLHEALHQLNEEVAHLDLAKWLDEGLSEYFATSLIESNQIAIGQIDINTYPVWWIDELATADSLEANLTNKSVIPLRAIITDHGGPSLNLNVNLYYLHWWTLTHFLCEHGEYHQRVPDLLRRGGGLVAFEELIGPVPKIEREWHTHIRQLKSELAKGTTVSRAGR
jgi:hypothetical protein